VRQLYYTKALKLRKRTLRGASTYWNALSFSDSVDTKFDFTAVALCSRRPTTSSSWIRTCL